MWRVNWAVLQLIQSLFLAISLPGIVTNTHMKLSHGVMRLMGADQSALPYAQWHVHRASILSIFATTIALVLARPLHSVFKKWLTNVWEREYVIEVGFSLSPALADC